jgi:hypothetical protein
MDFALLMITLLCSQVSNPVPPHLSYAQTVQQFYQWEREKPELVTLGSYGVDTEGQLLYCLMVTNKKIVTQKKRVLISACIHGNEPWSAACVMAYLGTILNSHNNPQYPYINNMLDCREIYFIPVMCPDNYPHSRTINGVDPNRNWSKNPSIAPIESLKNFHRIFHFDAMISGHTYGRIFLYPSALKNHQKTQQLLSTMATWSNYDKGATGGSTLDLNWFYNNGAFAIIIEYGTHQRIPTPEQICSEFQRTYWSVILFIQDGPNVLSDNTYTSQPDNDVIDFLKNHPEE